MVLSAIWTIVAFRDGGQPPGTHDPFPWQPLYFGQPYRHPFAQTSQSSQQSDSYLPFSAGSSSHQSAYGSAAEPSHGSYPPLDTDNNNTADATSEDESNNEDDSGSSGNPDWDRVREVGTYVIS